jgi:hypothetical protein
MVDNGKAKIENSFGNLTMTIPSKKNWLALIGGTLWMGWWYFGFKPAAYEMFANHLDFSGVGSFAMIWLAGWTVGGIAIAGILLWGYFGQEKLASDRQFLNFRKTVFGIGLVKKLDASQVKNFRAEVTNANWLESNRWAFWGLGPGKIKFDYGLKTYSFGLGVDDAEANHIVEVLKGYFHA